jgi:hypothetical protein
MRNATDNAKRIAGKLKEAEAAGDAKAAARWATLSFMSG